MKNVLIIEIQSFVHVISCWFLSAQPTSFWASRTAACKGACLRARTPWTPITHSSAQLRQADTAREGALDWPNSSIAWGTAFPGIVERPRAQLRKLEVDCG